MSCNSCGENPRQRIVKGEDAEVLFNVRYENGSFFDLTGKTLSAKLKNDDGSVLTLTGGAVAGLAPLANGKGKLTITDTQSALLLAGEAVGFDLIIVDGSDVKIVPFRRALEIIERIA